MKTPVIRMTAVLAVAGLFAGCSTPADETASPEGSSTRATKTVPDVSGKPVAVPAAPLRIADSWPAHTEVVMLLGAGGKIVATANSAKNLPWMFTVQPGLKDAIQTNAQNFNPEALLAKRPDVYFMSPGNANADKISSLGIPTVTLDFQNFPQMKQTITSTAAVLGGDAPDRAVRYNAELDRVLTQVSDVAKTIPAAEKPKVLHIQSLDPLQIDGGGTIVDDWISAAGGVNVAHDVVGHQKPVTLEQVLSWKPDVVIVGTPGKDGAAAVKGDPRWQQIPAVTSGRVYNNPVGVFGWDRYSPEELLQLQWAALTLHPDRYRDIDIRAAVKAYYRDYLGYPLTDGDVQRILSAQPPA